MVLCAENGLGPSRRTIMYAFTLTLPSRLYHMTAEEQAEATIDIIKGCRLGQARALTVMELTSSFNLHYHGVIDFLYEPALVSNYAKLFSDWIRKQPKLGKMFKIKVCDDLPGWLAYIFKNIQYTWEAVHRDPVVRDDFGLTPQWWIDSGRCDLPQYQDPKPNRHAFEYSDDMPVPASPRSLADRVLIVPYPLPHALLKLYASSHHATSTSHLQT